MSRADEPQSESARRAVIVAEKVREMDDAADHARSWTQPGSCGIGNEMPCCHERCILRAGNYAAYWTQLAARCAITLESLTRESITARRIGKIK